MFKGLLLVLLVLAPSAIAHRLAPSLLSLTEVSAGQFEVIWKTPIATQAGKTLQPVLPQMCQTNEEPRSRREGSGIVWQWTVDCKEPLVGQSLSVVGMEASATATLVNISGLKGERIQRLLTKDKPTMTIPEQQARWQMMSSYAWLGVEHIGLGIDHLLLVLALVLLVPNRRSLIWTITAFTVGHSITLSLVALGYVDYPVSLVEFAIAASIFILAVELVNRARAINHDSRFANHSGLVAVSFGLLHGMGFAGALREVGLPTVDIPLALVSFNAGIEAGQVIFVLLALAVMSFGRRCLPALVKPGWWTTVYGIGACSAFWCVERGLGVLA